MDSNLASALRSSREQPEAFVQVYDAHFRGLVGFLSRRTCDAEAGLDLAAETLAQAFLSRKGFRGKSDAEAVAWLYRIAQRQLAGYQERGRAERNALDRLAIEVPSLSPGAVDEIERLASLDQLRELLRPAIGELSTERRDALWLRVVDDLSFREVAARLGITEVAARVRVSRALSQLADSLEATGITQLEEIAT